MRLFCLLLLLLATLLQGWITLGLLDARDDPWSLLDDRPILSGRHPLLLYHGYLGAKSLHERWCLCCYDPLFHAGYPKTPVFDAGSRPAELALALAGGRFSPGAYKVGLAVLCLVVPVVIFAATRAAGLSPTVALLSALLGQVLFWGPLGRDNLEAGNLDLLLGSLVILFQSGMLVRFHHRSSVLGWLNLACSSLLAWFAHPLLSVLSALLLLVYFFSVSHRHRLAWHFSLLLALLLGLLANSFWLGDLVRHWWIRVPPPATLPGDAASPGQSWPLVHLLGTGIDLVLASLLLASGVMGIVLLHRNGQRTMARVFGAGVVVFLVLAWAGLRWDPLLRLGSWSLLFPALLFAVPASAFLLRRLADPIARLSGTIVVPVALATGLLVLVGVVVPGESRAWVSSLIQPRPLPLGLGEDRLALVEELKAATHDGARILWEDHKDGDESSRWTVLLPLLAQRALVGGLGADAEIEHASGGLVDGQLAGRSLDQWSDAELEEYCNRYNIGWVVCSSPAARERLSRWKITGERRKLASEPEAELMTLKRKQSYALAGSVRWVSADERGILLADAVPQSEGSEEGQVLLSLHYQEGMRVRPARVRLEQAVDSQDTIPFVRLRMKEPVGRIFITWEAR